MARKTLVQIARNPGGTTRRELVDSLRDAGWYLRREGASHEVWAKGRVQVFIPRHRGDLAKGTVSQIARDALAAEEENRD
jgi:predicted RNA binding protein YcfA (HicA-like mRNA interferase family)